MNCNYIMVTKLDQRTTNAVDFQRVLTDSGCSIRARLGLHEVSEDACSNDGIVILQLFATGEQAQQLERTLNGTSGVKAHLVDLND